MTRCYTALLSTIAILAGCQSPYPNSDLKDYGAAVRATLASEIVAPQARPERGADGVAAAAAYTNYQRSYVTPTAQSDSPTFGKK